MRISEGNNTTISFYSHHFPHRPCSIGAQTDGGAAVDCNASLKQCLITAGSTAPHENRSIRIAIISVIRNGGYDKKHPQDARELRVHTAGEGDSLTQLTFDQKTAGDRYVLARTPASMRET